MKLLKYFWLLVAASMVVGFTACEDEEEKEQAIPDDKALEIVKSTLTDSVSGVYSQMNGMNFSMVKSEAKPSESIFDTTFTSSAEYNLEDVYISYNANYSVSINALGILNMSYGMESTYDGPKIKRVTDDTASYEMTGFMSDTITLNGTSTHIGEMTFKNDEEKSYNYNITYTYTEVKMMREGEANSGTLTFTMTGTTPAGNNYSVEGSLDVNEGGSGTLVIGDKTYTIDLQTGFIP